MYLRYVRGLITPEEFKTWWATEVDEEISER